MNSFHFKMSHLFLPTLPSKVILMIVQHTTSPVRNYWIALFQSFFSSVLLLEYYLFTTDTYALWKETNYEFFIDFVLVCSIFILQLHTCSVNSQSMCILNNNSDRESSLIQSMVYLPNVLWLIIVYLWLTYYLYSLLFCLLFTITSFHSSIIQIIYN